MALEHHSFKYNTETNPYPEYVGDRYQGQDRGRDFYFLMNEMGKLKSEKFVDFPVLLQDPAVREGSTYQRIYIPSCKGLVNFEIDVPDDFSSVPPTVKQEDIIVQVESTDQNDIDISSSATLDGASVNYVKMAYAEADGSSRTRARKGGTYVYEKIPSFTITVNTTAPTDYEVVLAEIVGDGSTFMTITNRVPTPDYRTGDIEKGITAEAISVNDPVGAIETGEIRKAGSDVMFSDYSAYAGTFYGSGITWLSEDTFIIIYIKSSDQHLYARVGQYLDGGGSPTWLSSETQVTTTTTRSTTMDGLSCAVKQLTGDQFVIGWINNSTNDEPTFRVGTYSGGSISWDSSITTLTTGADCNAIDLAVFDTDDNRFVFAYDESSTIKSCIGSYSGGTITFTSIVNFSATASNGFGVGGDPRTKQWAIFAHRETSANWEDVYLRFGQYLGGAVNYLTSETKISHGQGGVFGTAYGDIVYCEENVCLVRYQGSYTFVKYDTGTVEQIQQYDSLFNCNGNYSGTQCCKINDDTIIFHSQIGNTKMIYKVIKYTGRGSVVLVPETYINTTTNYNGREAVTPIAQKGRSLHLMEHYNSPQLRMDGIRFVNCDGIALNNVSSGNLLTYLVRGKLPYDGAKKGTDYYVNLKHGASPVLTSEYYINKIGEGIKDQIIIDAISMLKESSRGLINGAGVNRHSGAGQVNNYVGGLIEAHVYPLPAWNMTLTGSKSISTDPSFLLGGILLLTACIFPDDDSNASSPPIMINMPCPDTTIPGRVEIDRNGIVTTYRNGGGYLDSNTNYNGTDKSRGMVLMLVWKGDYDKIDTVT